MIVWKCRSIVGFYVVAVAKISGSVLAHLDDAPEGFTFFDVMHLVRSLLDLLR